MYSNMKQEAKESREVDFNRHIDSVIDDMIRKSRRDYQVVKTFKMVDKDNSGHIDCEEFARAYLEINPNVSLIQLRTMFQEADLDGNGTIELDEVSCRLLNFRPPDHQTKYAYRSIQLFNQFIQMTEMAPVDLFRKIGVVDRDARGLMQVMPSTETYFGEDLTHPTGVGLFIMSQSQHLAMELYESRIASMQRFVAMTIMFHRMGMRVQSFFERISFGLLGYRMDRTHSIMRIATTASPVSGADVRDRMLELHLRYKILNTVNLISRTFDESKRVVQQRARRRSSLAT